MTNLRLMKWLVAAVIAASIVALPAYARGGRGGGGGGFRGGGGGGYRGGGGFSGGGMRAPSGGGMRSPGGGGFSRSPAVSAPRPSGGGARPGAGAGNRPGGGPGHVTNFPAGGGRPGGGAGNRPGGGPGLGNRPGIDNRPGGGPGLGNRPGIGDRPGGGPGLGNRPGIGDRPGIADRPGVGNRPGIGDRPGGGVGNRPGIGDNNLGNRGNNNIGNRGNNNVINRSGNNNLVNRGDININNRQNNFVGNRVDPGYGVRPPAYNNWRGAYGGYHQGWMNGYWHGYHNGTGWNWGSFALGSALGVTAWGLGSALYSWGYASYGNPYYGGAVSEPIVIQQPIDNGGYQTVTVPASTFDYSQPLDTQSQPPPPQVADPAVAKFDSARESFKRGDYASALRLTDEALKTLPNDATLHEFRALTLFAAGQYEQAAIPLYAVLSVGPGWDWTTMIGLYPTADVYTKQLRALEQFIKKNPKSSGARFVLAYQYLTQGHNSEALGQLKEVQKLAPGDALSAQLIKTLSPPGETPEPSPSPATAPASKEGTLAGTWKATPVKQTAINLNVRDDGNFTWKASVNGKSQDIAGNWSLAGGILTLAQSGDGSALVGNVTWQDATHWNFRALGAPANDPGLSFSH